MRPTPPKSLARWTTIVLLSLFSYAVAGQTLAPLATDTTYLGHTMAGKTRLIDKITTTKAFQISRVGVPLIIGGLIIKGEDEHFRFLRNTYTPDLKFPYDDYITLVPLATTLGLKIAGVKGRSSWGRMLVSDAFSAALVAISVNSLKYSLKVRRPDGTKRNSFPSGHTAVAFMSATMLHKEYGLTRSPWFSIGAYAYATGIGLSRILNNRHWVSDVMAGAGFGILSTELGYFLADLIFKDRGLQSPLLDFSDYDFQRPPSFFGLHMGFNLLPTPITLPNGIRLTSTAGSSAGFEGAWFANRFIGIGGRLSAASLPLYPSESDLEIQLDPLSVLSGSVGAYFSYPVANYFLIGGKCLVGGSYFLKNTITNPANEQAEELKIAEIDDFFGANLITGASVTCALKPQLGIRLFFDYNLNPIRLEMEENAVSYTGKRQWLHSMTLGGSINVMF